MMGTAPLASTPAEAESVEVYRRYPPPEILQLAARPRASPAPPLCSASSADPVTPRHRSPAASPPPSAASPSSSSQPAEAFQNKDDGAHVRVDERAAAECGENQTGKHKPTSHVSVRLRWGVEADDLRRVYELHEDAFPLSYEPAYYEHLLNHDTWMGLVATVTPKAYTQWVDRAATEEVEEGEEEETKKAGDDVPLAWFPGYTPSPAEAATGPRPVPPSASQRPLTVEMCNERAQVDSMLTELEYIAHRRQRAEAKTAEKTQSYGSSGSRSEDKKNTPEDDDSAYTEVVGFILGQCGYARHDDGHLFTNPTSYIGSFVVDPRFQCCGLGSALLQRYLIYATQQRPLYAQDYLHYDERKLIAMLVQAQLKKRSGSPSTADANGNHSHNGSGSKGDNVAAAAKYATSGPSSASAPSPLPSLFYQLVSAYLPETLAWWEDRQTRQRLRERGLSEDQIDAQRFRDLLAPDVLTDEEADEVRRDARRFVVQTGTREVWLHCLPGNAKANLLYARRGFRLHRLLRDYYNVDEEKYDAYLLMYVSPAVVVGTDDGLVGATQHPLAVAGAAAMGAEMDSVMQQQDSEGLAQLNNTISASAAAVVVGEGMRRRYTNRTTAGSPEQAATANDSGAPLPFTDPTAGIAVAAVHRDASSASSLPPADSSVESNTDAVWKTPAVFSSNPSVSAAAAPSSGTRRSLGNASWLTPRTYPVVADIILCTAAEGQAEWRRRVGGSGDVTGQRSWWETGREVVFLANAIGLFCAVLWLTYNVGVTGKVE
ncbi:hypothetical protein ABB37_06218 [Leptomonas pyrrhocoris]|uniref:N-alpha-acetyltransferase 60 n=1 Tax=Leptomonas pyrrhocoris TaxID=157538 RepID=A0A0N0DU98_LEPPY|nr:hypothetical protein ABB37_06218 [Leptomonas pyrrhocoris]KPA78618.1 hypothetical protein ABB37_06218 [Leptomonas pyrrhocoris]|eukprot:XP_015657057.1 hypothetical protein ABB37_06218 [Leptomonas pyrrhocoris]